MVSTTQDLDIADLVMLALFASLIAGESTKEPILYLNQGKSQGFMNTFTTTMEWIWGWIRRSPERSFRVRIKLNAKEAIYRFIKIRGGLGLPNKHITQLCRMVEKDGQLEGQLRVTAREISSTIRTLEKNRVGEREYLGHAVLEFERLLSEIKSLLWQVDMATKNQQNIPSGFYLRAAGLANQLRGERKLLSRLRVVLRTENGIPQAAATKCAVPMWMEKIWVFARISKFMNSGKVSVEEHHQRKHLFTGDKWRQSSRCNCLDYR